MGIPPTPATACLSSPGRVAFSTLHHPALHAQRATQPALRFTIRGSLVFLPPLHPAPHTPVPVPVQNSLPAASRHSLHSTSRTSCILFRDTREYLERQQLPVSSILSISPSHQSSVILQQHPLSLPVQFRELISCLSLSLGPQSLVLASSLHSTSALATLADNPAILPFSSAVLSRKAVRFRPLSPP